MTGSYWYMPRMAQWHCERKAEGSPWKSNHLSINIAHVQVHSTYVNCQFYACTSAACMHTAIAGKMANHRFMIKLPK